MDNRQELATLTAGTANCRQEHFHQVHLHCHQEKCLAQMVVERCVGLVVGSSDTAVAEGPIHQALGRIQEVALVNILQEFAETFGLVSDMQVPALGPVREFRQRQDQ